MITLENYKTNAEQTIENTLTATEADAVCMMIVKDGRTLLLVKPINKKGAFGLLNATEELHSTLSASIAARILTSSCQCPACTANRQQLRQTTTVH